MIDGASQQETKLKEATPVGRLFARLLARSRARESRLYILFMDWLEDLRAQDSDRLVLWLPVAFAFGAGLTCSVRADDPAGLWVGLTIGALSIWLIGIFLSQRAQTHAISYTCGLIATLALLFAAFLGGGAAGLLRAMAVAAPVIREHKVPLTVSGYVVQIDKTQNGVWRARIEVESLTPAASRENPSYVRLALTQDEPPRPGEKILCQAILRPPPGPVVPTAYDHARRAWFMKLGGVGYAIAPCKLITGQLPPDKAMVLILSIWRAQAARYLVETTPSPGAGFLAAITTGDRAWLSEDDVEALQVSGLSHIISVSGLHVGVLGTLIFLVIAKTIALIPSVALRFDARKVGASAALLGTGAYCIFSGAEAPAVRAFIMSAIAFGAILLDRKAISMRGLAIAAICVLVGVPESAIDPGFQMSFLATAGLVAMWEVWEAHHARDQGKPTPGPVHTVIFWLGAAAATSFVAGLATAPVAAATFGRISPWSLPANLLAAPINDFLVAPAAVLGALLAPIGLDGWAWALASWGLSRTLDIAHFMAELPGARARVAWTDATAPVVLILSILWLTLWRSRLRYMALLGFVLGLAIWIAAPKPVGWISPEGRAILATPAGEYPQLCRTTGGRFDASRLIDRAGLSPTQVQDLLPEGEHVIRRTCFVGQGDWEGRYVYAGRGRGTLALSFDGQSHAFGRGDLPDGALLMRNGWQLYFYPASPRKGPWAKLPADAGEDIVLHDKEQ
ncbi:ComEC/Rec2 family competence protein [Candidatus Phycosocius spiralis]|uniref:Competence protein ComEC n=1 Tax=Candidatus Phycosocius spiralis TaxID=2815099 RepID=A0ABQ4PSY0_9PROT|nr:ComEC/Rec2 family competence protein [Candidatus Phycosocius spiralis]GIU66091.1 competence protein ComEC [Candidatus Phycosocius spiralis]